MNLTRSTLIALALLFGASTTQAAPVSAPAAGQATIVELAAAHAKAKKPKAKKAAKKAAPKKKAAKKTSKKCKGAFMFSKGGKCMDSRDKKG